MHSSSLAAVEHYLDSLDMAVIDLTCDLVAAPSVNPPGDETAPAEVVHRFLRSMDLPEPKVIAREAHRPNLLVTIRGDLPGPHLAFCGHLDTKPAGDGLSEWRTDPWSPVIDGDRLYGLGSTDMKGAVAAMLMAASAINRAKDQLRGSVSFAFTADEELGSVYGAHYLVATDALAGVDALILGEPSGIHQDWDGLRIVSRGCACFRVVVRGTQMHSSISDRLPSVSAVEAMGRLMTGLRQEFRPRCSDHPLCPTGPTVNIGVKALGGVGYGVVAGHAEFWSDVRLVPGMSRQEFEEDLVLALERASEGIEGAEWELHIDPVNGWSEATEIVPDHPAVIAAQRASAAVLGHEMPLDCFPGGTDAIAFQAVAGIPTVAAFGPGQLPLAHAPNEWVSCSSVRQAMRMYARTAFEYGQLVAGEGETLGAGRNRQE